MLLHATFLFQPKSLLCDFTFMIFSVDDQDEIVYLEPNVNGALRNSCSALNLEGKCFHFLEPKFLS